MMVNSKKINKMELENYYFKMEINMKVSFKMEIKKEKEFSNIKMMIYIMDTFMRIKDMVKELLKKLMEIDLKETGLKIEFMGIYFLI